jgi:hypothetical protein
MLRFPPQAPTLAEQAVGHAALDPAQRLQTILKELERAHLELERTRYAADELPPGTPDDQIEDCLRKQRNAYRRWYEIQQQATQLEAETRRRQIENLQNFQLRYQQTYAELVESYGDLGPQYRLLTERLASLDARIAAMDQSQRDLSPAEIDTLNKLHLSFVNQLQRYTEATKSEVLNKQTQDVVNQILIIVEHRVSPANPQLWREVMHDVRSAVEQLGA